MATNEIPLPDGFLTAALAYIDQVAERPLDFSDDALRAQYQHETHGTPLPNPANNGYAIGKWTLGVTLAAIRQDFEDGLFTKSELLDGAGDFVRREIEKWPARTFFPYLEPNVRERRNHQPRPSPFVLRTRR